MRNHKAFLIRQYRIWGAKGLRRELREWMSRRGAAWHPYSLPRLADDTPLKTIARSGRRFRREVEVYDAD